MEIATTDILKPDVDKQATDKMSPEHETDIDSTTVKTVLQGHEHASASVITSTIPQLSKDMVTSVSELEGDQQSQCQSGTVEKDSVSHENVPNSGTEMITPKLSEAMEMNVCEKEDLGLNTQNETVDKDFVSGGGDCLSLLSIQYREQSSEELSDSESDSSSSTSSSSSSSDPTVLMINDHEHNQDEFPPGKRPPPVKTQDELLIEDLPAVENLLITLPEEAEIKQAGIISSIIDQLVVVESNKDTPPLNDDSVLFNKNRLSIGRVFEVFGPVCQPFYILRFNSQEDVEQRDLKISDPVFFAPKIKDFTDYVFVEKIKHSKGSDASWRNDHEPPLEALDFSDDEEERLAKQKLKQQRKQQHKNQEESNSDSESQACKPPCQKPPKRKPGSHQNWGSARGRAAHQSSFHTNQHANPHFQPNYMLPPPGPYHPPFQGFGFPPYTRLPFPHMGIDPWHPGTMPYPGPMFYPPPPPPPSS